MLMLNAFEFFFRHELQRLPLERTESLRLDAFGSGGDRMGVAPHQLGHRVFAFYPIDAADDQPHDLSILKNQRHQLRDVEIKHLAHVQKPLFGGQTHHFGCDIVHFFMLLPISGSVRA